MSEVRYERTGEFRSPKPGEWYEEWTVTAEPFRRCRCEPKQGENSRCDTQWILRRVETEAPMPKPPACPECHKSETAVYRADSYSDNFQTRTRYTFQCKACAHMWTQTWDQVAPAPKPERPGTEEVVAAIESEFRGGWAREGCKVLAEAIRRVRVHDKVREALEEGVKAERAKCYPPLTSENLLAILDGEGTP